MPSGGNHAAQKVTAVASDANMLGSSNALLTLWLYDGFVSACMARFRQARQTFEIDASSTFDSTFPTSQSTNSRGGCISM
jgi:hypothetical protein